MAEASGLDVGATAPDFTAPLVTPDGAVTDVTFSDIVADGPVLLVFYTNDFSPDCIEEWCSFRDFDWFTANDEVQVVGVSKSGTYFHRRFIDRLDLGFPLYSDGDLDVAEAYDVEYRTFKLLSRARRSCFLVDAEMTVRYRWFAEHWIDPTRDVPPVGDIYEAVTDRLDDAEEATGEA